MGVWFSSLGVWFPTVSFKQPGGACDYTYKDEESGDLCFCLFMAEMLLAWLLFTDHTLSHPVFPQLAFHRRFHGMFVRTHSSAITRTMGSSEVEGSSVFIMCVQ